MVKNGRIIKLDTDKKIEYERICSNNKIMVDGEVFSETGIIGQIMLEDGTFIEDPQNVINEQIQQALRNKQEAYKEFKEMSDIYGFDSEQAISAKNAYTRIDETTPDKSRYELETELSEVPQKIEQSNKEAIDAFTLELIEGGLL